MSDRLTTGLSESGVFTLRLNRPKKRNAMDTAMIEALLAALEAADLDAAVNVVLLRGAGKDFCAGYDGFRARATVGSVCGADHR